MKSDRLDLLRRVQRRTRPICGPMTGSLSAVEDGRPAEAVRYYTAALALQPASPGIALNRGTLSWRQRSWTRPSRTSADPLRSLRSTSWPTTTSATPCHKGLGDEAIAEYREAIRIDPDFAEAHLHLGVALEAKGRLDEAEDAYAGHPSQQSSAQGPRQSRQSARAGGEPDVAIAEFREVIRLDKDHAWAHIDLGNGLEDKGRLDEAIAEYREAIRIDKATCMRPMTNSPSALGQGRAG